MFETAEKCVELLYICGIALHVFQASNSSVALPVGNICWTLRTTDEQKSDYQGFVITILNVRRSVQ